MKHQTKVIALVALTSLLVVLVAVSVGMAVLRNAEEKSQTQSSPTTEPEQTGDTQLASHPAQSDPTDSADQTEETTLPDPADATEVEQKEQWFTLSFAGDCTMGSTASTYWYESSYIQTIGEDYGYPFRNVYDYFAGDDFTIVNLECALTKDGGAADKLFTFKGPPEYTEILTGSSVEAVTLANNHSMDYGTIGYNSTTKALKEAGVPYVEKNGTAMVTTLSGLKIGLYAGCFDFSVADMKAKIGALRNQGAEIVICAFHWGTEGSYRPTGNQEYFGRAAIDAGADIVYGHHPHVLQKIEKYGNGVIMYSLGNFSFGGSTFPKDYDSAIVQVQVIRDENGKVRLGDTTAIPVLISSMSGQNNYQPTPVEEGTDVYNRILSKLDGTFTGPDLVVDYSILNPTESTEPSESETTESTEPTETTAPTEPSETTPTETTPTETTPTETTPPETTPPETTPTETTPPDTTPPDTTPPDTKPPEITPPVDPPDPPAE